MCHKCEAYEDRIDALERRVNRLEAIFAPNLIDRQTRHLDAKERDAFDVLSEGEEHTMMVSSPIGEGQAEDATVGRIHGVVTFIRDADPEVEEGAFIRVRLTEVRSSTAHGTMLGRYEPGEYADAPEGVTSDV